MNVKFSKYEGTGNDFVLIDNRDGVFPVSEELITALCDRRFGIGADGLMLLEEAQGAEFRMRYFNSDGPESTMCGNGGRCISLFAHHLGIDGEVFLAADGPHTARVMETGGETGIVKLRMSDVGIFREYDNGFFLDTGSPHYVEVVDDVARVDVVARGRELRNSAMFAMTAGANINFMQFDGPGHIRVRTYERGVEAETLACGTGAVASVIAAAVIGGSDISEYVVNVPGGTLNVSFRRVGKTVFNDVFLTGPARRVFTGEFEIENF